MDRPSDLIQSVSRALHLLEIVGQEPRGLAPKAVAARAGLGLSTTYHLLRTLAYEGYLIRTSSGDYMLGLEIADRFRDLVTTLARPPGIGSVLRELSARVGLSVYLARLVDGHVTIVQVAEGPHSPLLEDLIPGFDEGAHATALGRALLSTLSVPARRSYLSAAGMRRFTSVTVTEVDRLEQELRSVRDGVFVEDQQYRRNVSCMALLVDLPDTDGSAALGVSATASHLARDRDALGLVLRTAAVDLAG